jgi:serine/threonine-protein kinase
MDEVAEIVRQLAEALSATHAVGIIHRDLKPENIIYDAAHRRVKLLDFGIARDAQEPSAERLTRAGFFVGSLQYVSPEALTGELVSEAADIYSLATITFYLLTGSHPHPGRTPRELFHQLLSEEPRSLAEAVGGGKARFSPALEAALRKGLARNPRDRQPSVTVFAQEVAQAVASGELQPGPSSLFGAIRSWIGSREKD